MLAPAPVKPPRPVLPALSSPIRSGVLVTNPTAYAGIEAIGRGLTQGLRQLGCDVDLLLNATGFAGEDIHAQPVDEVVSRVMARLSSGGSRFLIDVNLGTHYEALDASGQRVAIDAALPVVHASYMTDHPMPHWPRHDRIGPRTLLTYVDQRHEAVLRQLGVTAPCLFLPHGGPPPQADPIPYRDRDIDILFVGNLFGDFGLDSLVRRTSGMDRRLQAATRAAAELALDRRADVLEALTAAFADQGLNLLADFDPQDAVLVWSEVSQCVETTVRWRLLSSLKSCRLTIAGNAPKGLYDRLGGNATYLGPIPFARFEELTRRSRLALNIVPSFHAGGHERIFHAMAQGTAVATDENAWLSTLFPPDVAALYWPFDAAADRLEAAVAAPQVLEGLAEAARPIYAAGHTWNHRAAALLAALDQLASAATPAQEHLSP